MKSLSTMAVGPTALTGSSRRLFQATMRPAELPSTRRQNSASQEIRPASHTRTRTAAGTTNCRTATIGQLPKSRVEEAEYCVVARIKAAFPQIRLRNWVPKDSGYAINAGFLRL